MSQSTQGKTTTKKRTPLPKIDKDKLKVRVPILKIYKKLRSNYCANFSQTKYFTILDKGLSNIHKLEEKLDEKHVQEAEQVVQQHQSKKKKIFNWILVGFNVVFIAVFVFMQMQQGIAAPAEKISANWWFLFIALGFSVLWVVVDTARFYVLIHKATSCHRPTLAYKISAFGKYYDIITPFSTGGQPFQIFYSNKYGIKGGQSVSIVMSKYMFQQIAYFILTTVVLFSNLAVSTSGAGTTGGAVFTVMCWIGYIITAVLILGVCLIMLNKKVGVGIVVFFLKLFCKLFKRDYNKQFRKVMRTVTTWQRTMRRYRKSPFIWIFNILASLAFFLIQYSIPFFIYCAFEGFHPEVWYRIVTITIMVDLSASFNPLPGGTGVSELSFDALFRSLFHGSTIWAMLIWRILTLYIYLAQGLFMLGYDYTIGNRRLKKNKEMWIVSSMSKQNRIKYLKSQSDKAGK